MSGGRLGNLSSPWRCVLIRRFLSCERRLRHTAYAGAHGKHAARQRVVPRAARFIFCLDVVGRARRWKDPHAAAPSPWCATLTPFAQLDNTRSMKTKPDTASDFASLLHPL